MRAGARADPQAARAGLCWSPLSGTSAQKLAPLPENAAPSTLIEPGCAVKVPPARLPSVRADGA
jgi:hypothetical protein